MAALRLAMPPENQGVTVHSCIRRGNCSRHEPHGSSRQGPPACDEPNRCHRYSLAGYQRQARTHVDVVRSPSDWITGQEKKAYSPPGV